MDSISVRNAVRLQSGSLRIKHFCLIQCLTSADAVCGSAVTDIPIYTCDGVKNNLYNTGDAKSRHVAEPTVSSPSVTGPEAQGPAKSGPWPDGRPARARA
jgi:hypothetical protein